ncbi:MAG: rRNA maturation RNase YbeY [Marinifilaceae bacterium]
MIDFNFEEIDAIDIKLEEAERWITQVIEKNNMNVGELTYIFCSDEYLLEINKQYLQHDYFTDIITFNYCEGDTISGDLFISVDTVLDNAKTFGVDYLTELNRVIIHGVLHLIGFDDKCDEDQEEMTRQENLSLELLNN